MAKGAKYLSNVKFIATEAPTFFGYIISVLASVSHLERLAPLTPADPHRVGSKFTNSQIAQGKKMET